VTQTTNPKRPGSRRWLLASMMAGAAVLALAASPAPAADAETARPSLLPLAQPLWSELSAAQHEVLAPLEPQWNALPAAKKRSWLKLADRVPKMKPPEREKAQERIREWATLTPEQRRLARNNYRLAKSLDKEEREASWEQYNSMTDEQRSVLRANGWTSNTAARHAGAPTGLAKEAARPLPGALLPTLNQRRPAVERSTLK
jgi:hypothetical protein